MKQLAVIFLLMVLIAPQALGLTAAIGNARTIINVEASPENPAILERTLKVLNKNDIPVKIHLNPSLELRPFITLLDNDFVIEPGDEYLAEFILTIDRGGNIDGVINVLFSPAEEGVKENEVGLSSRLIIVSDGPIIDEPETETETEEETQPETEQESEEETEVEVETETETEEESEENTESDNKPVITNKPSAENEGGANPLVGLGIMAAVIVLGLVVFVVVMKVMKK